MKALLLVTCVAATALVGANHPGSHHHHHGGHYVHSVSYKLPGASYFNIKQVFPSFHHGGHHQHQMDHNHSSQAASSTNRGRAGRVNNFNPFNPRYTISRHEVSDDEWQAELAETFAESGLLNTEGSILHKVPRGLVNINFDTHACVHMGTHLQASTCSERPTQVSYPLPDPNSDELYTLVMLDVDTPAPYLHWMVDNIPGSKVAKGTTVADYASPHPTQLSSKPHRYLVVVMPQKDGRRKGNVNEDWAGVTPCQETGRADFNLDHFREKYNLGEVIAANYFQVDFDPDYAPSCQKDRLSSVLA